MTNNTPSGTKKHRESTEPEIHQMANVPRLVSDSSANTAYIY